MVGNLKNIHVKHDFTIKLIHAWPPVLVDSEMEHSENNISWMATHLFTSYEYNVVNVFLVNHVKFRTFVICDLFPNRHIAKWE